MKKNKIHYRIWYIVLVLSISISYAGIYTALTEKNIVAGILGIIFGLANGFVLDRKSQAKNEYDDWRVGNE